MTLGGRAAEEIVFGEITTGASNDLEKVTATAKQMVMRFGMSDKLGPRVFGHDHGQPFLGREFSTEPDYSDEIAREIDDEVRRIIEARPPARARDPRPSTASDLDEDLARSSSTARRSRRRSSWRCSTGKSEEDVFGLETSRDARAAGAAACRADRAPSAKRRARSPRPRPRRRRRRDARRRRPERARSSA